MKLIVHLFLTCVLLIFALPGMTQTTVLDFETPETTTSFQYFGSSLDGSLSTVIDNPDPSGVNTSSQVMRFVKPAGAQVWAGAFSNPNPIQTVDFTTNDRICIKAWMPRPGNISLKLENSSNGGDNWIQTVTTDVSNSWVELCFDASLPSIEGPFTSAAGFIYNTVVIFAYFGEPGGATDEELYLDEFIIEPNVAGTVVLDFETVETSTTFQYFGSSLDGSLSEVIDNPDPTGANTSSQVLRFVKPAGAQVWAGAFSNPNPNQMVDFSTNGRICIKAWMPRPGNISLKLENSTNGGDNWIQTVTTDVSNSWVELCYDASLPSIEGPFTSAAGFVYSTVVIFAYFGEPGGATDEEVYLDEFILEPSVSETVILDFEAEATTTNFQYFGSALDGQLANIISNPDASGINTSDTVLEFKKPGDAQVWAGAFSNPTPTIPVNATNGGQVCIKVWSATPGNLALKLENSPTGSNWIQTQTFETTNAWTEVCYDLTLPSIEGPFEPAAGIYATIVLFFDFGTAGGGVEKTFYLDDVVLRTTSASTSNVIFSVNAGVGAGDVFLMGSFNDWTPTQMADAGNGIYTMEMDLENGVYEYKYLLGSVAEEFSGLDECTVTSSDGEFTNRRLIVSGDEELDVVCFNSCYNCGDAVQITVNLGFSGVEPSDAGVYLAGGLAFGAPGGRFLMLDTDGDGVYSISIERARGFTSYYAFANGNCPDYSCKEDISGQDCANPDNFNDRLMSPVQGDLVINTCFAICSDNVECTNSTSEEAKLLEGFDLHPTIVHDKVNLVRGSLFEGQVILHVTDLQGRVIQQQMMSAFEQRKELDFSMLKSGMYLLSMKAEGGFKSVKFVKM